MSIYEHNTVNVMFIAQRPKARGPTLIGVLLSQQLGEMGGGRGDFYCDGSQQKGTFLIVLNHTSSVNSLLVSRVRTLVYP